MLQDTEITAATAASAPDAVTSIEWPVMVWRPSDDKGTSAYRGQAVWKIDGHSSEGFVWGIFMEPYTEPGMNAFMVSFEPRQEDGAIEWDDVIGEKPSPEIEFYTIGSDGCPKLAARMSSSEVLIYPDFKTVVLIRFPNAGVLCIAFGYADFDVLEEMAYLGQVWTGNR